MGNVYKNLKCNRMSSGRPRSRAKPGDTEIPAGTCFRSTRDTYAALQNMLPVTLHSKNGKRAEISEFLRMDA